MDTPDNFQISNKQIHDPDEGLAYGAFVRAGRTALGLSQTALATILGVHRTTLLRLEKGSPPLRRGLCESAVYVLGRAGVTCEVLQKGNFGSNGGTKDLQIMVIFDALKRAELVVTSGEDEKEFGRLLLGEGFIAPLQEKPLRRK